MWKGLIPTTILNVSFSESVPLSRWLFRCKQHDVLLTAIRGEVCPDNFLPFPDFRLLPSVL
jgi:hypothetical protein